MGAGTLGADGDFLGSGTSVGDDEPNPTCVQAIIFGGQGQITDPSDDRLSFDSQSERDGLIKIPR